MKRVYIRTDGNEIVATGHVMRCLSIAEQLRKAGIEVIFLLADDKMFPILHEKRFRTKILDTKWNDLEKETDILIRYLREQDAEVLLLDSYYITEEYLQNLSKYIRIVYIDDLNKFAYPVHTILHYAPFADVEKYKQFQQIDGRSTRFLIGGQYIPLREEFDLKKRVIKKEVHKVLITTGGTDRLNMAGIILERAQKESIWGKLEFHVVVGPFFQNKEKLYQMKEKYENIILHKNVKKMSELMRDCDIAVSAGGSTLYEICACGTPCICFEIADNQNGASVWEEKGYMMYAGNAYMEKQNCIERCIRSIQTYCESYSLRCECSEKMQELVDGKGAGRIAEYIVDMLEVH